ncbi:hypothetical protein GCM10010440_15960 [Kitasatospora cinereorecta]
MRSVVQRVPAGPPGGYAGRMIGVVGGPEGPGEWIMMFALLWPLYGTWIMIALGIACGRGPRGRRAALYWTLSWLLPALLGWVLLVPKPYGGGPHQLDDFLGILWFFFGLFVLLPWGTAFLTARRRARKRRTAPA